MFEFLNRFLPKKLAIKPREPEAKAEVPGFTVTLEKKEGVLLHYKAKEGEPEGSGGDASENFYYEVTATPTGENPEYPASEPLKGIFTVALDKGTGFNGGVQYIPGGGKFTGFKLVEEFDDGQIRGMYIGRRRPPHHTIMLRAEFKDADGRDGSMAIGRGWVRKSELESDAWKASDRGPVVHYI